MDNDTALGFVFVDLEYAWTWYHENRAGYVTDFGWIEVSTDDFSESYPTAAE